MRVSIHRMNRRIVGALAVALLGACASAPKPAPDQIVVVWQRVDDIQATCNQLSGRKELFRLRGCSKWSDSAQSRTCAIYAPAPKSEMDTQAFVTLGHELMHCFEGHWHDRWGRMNEPERQTAIGETRKPQSGAAAAD